jgi:hypothetical protein
MFKMLTYGQFLFENVSKIYKFSEMYSEPFVLVAILFIPCTHFIHTSLRIHYKI